MKISYPKTFINYLNDIYQVLRPVTNVEQVNQSVVAGLTMLSEQIKNPKSCNLKREIATWPNYTKRKVQFYISIIIDSLSNKNEPKTFQPLFVALYTLLLNLESTEIVASNPILLGFNELIKIVRLEESQPGIVSKIIDKFAVDEEMIVDMYWEMATMSIISGLKYDIDYKNFQFSLISNKKNTKRKNTSKKNSKKTIAVSEKKKEYKIFKRKLDVKKTTKRKKKPEKDD